MTIASKLFYCRRSRVTTRISDLRPPEELAGDRDGAARRAPRSRRAGHEDGERAARRNGSSSSRRQLSSHCAAGQSELETIRLDRGIGELAAGIRSTHGVENSIVTAVRVRRDELDPQLPCSVLQARARLVERLRDFRFTDSRGQVSFQITTLNEHTSAEQLSINDSRDLKAGTVADFFQSGISDTTVTDQVYGSQSMNNKPRLSRNVTLSSQQGELFEAVFGDNASMALPECSICLERFLDGDKLMRLACGHRFHHSCLEPWVQAHEVCPYCRASIIN